MDLSVSHTDEEFQRRLDSWIADNLDPRWRATLAPASKEWVAFQKDWDRRLYEGGWAGMFWPTEFGGTDATLTQRFRYAQTMAEAGAPEGLAKVGRRLLAPILMRYGTAEQQERYLGPILRAEEFWCQGFSEPDAGSDLAALRTRADATDDGFVVNGQKVWTSHAKYCDWCFILARTSVSERKHDGISFLLLPMDTPGITIRPIRQITGGSEFAEVFFDDVRVPRSGLVGELGDGWRVAMSTLAFERGVEQALGKSASTRNAFERTLRMFSDSGLTPDEAPAYELGRMEAEIVGVYVNARRLLSTQLEGGQPNELASVLKLQSSEAWRRSAFEQLSLLPPGAMQEHDGAVGAIGDYLASRSATIAAGTSEIQRDIIAKRLLGMGRKR